MFGQRSIEIISTHALTEGDNISRSNAGCVGISTHALTEGDLAIHFHRLPKVFQLTPSRRATYPVLRDIALERISTHALTEGDLIFR